MVNELIIRIACFAGGTIFGAIVGILLERKINKGQGDSILDDKTLRMIVAFVIIAVWTTSAGISAFLPDRHTPLELHILMGGVFGILLNKGSNPILDNIVKRVTTVNTNNADGTNTVETKNETTTTNTTT